MKFAGVFTGIGLAFFGAVFIYIAFFEKDITRESALICLLSGLGCLAFATIIGLLAELVHNTQDTNR